jgi:hypothetical protein
MRNRAGAFSVERLVDFHHGARPGCRNHRKANAQAPRRGLRGGVKAEGVVVLTPGNQPRVFGGGAHVSLAAMALPRLKCL